MRSQHTVSSELWSDHNGGLAHSGERLVCNQEASGAEPLTSIDFLHRSLTSVRARLLNGDCMVRFHGGE